MGPKVNTSHYTCALYTDDVYVLELKEIEKVFMSCCGSASSLMTLEQFSSVLIQLGFIPELCQQCFK